LVPPQPYPEYRRSVLYPSLCAHNTNATYASPLRAKAKAAARILVDMKVYLFKQKQKYQEIV
jgi:hypothetical protein